MRSRFLLPAVALLAIGGIAGAQGAVTSQQKAAPTATTAKMAGPNDSTAHAKKSRRRRHRTTAKATKDSTSAKMKSMSGTASKSTTKKP